MCFQIRQKDEVISEKSVEVESQQNDAEYELKKLGDQLSFLTNNLQDKQREITQLKVSSANIPDVHVQCCSQGPSYLTKKGEVYIHV